MPRDIDEPSCCCIERSNCGADATIDIDRAVESKYVLFNDLLANLRVRSFISREFLETNVYKVGWMFSWDRYMNPRDI